jgi:hypothetical protein
VVRVLAFSNDPEGYAGRSVKLLVVSPKSERPKVMGQTKIDTPVLQRWGFVGQASNLPTVNNLYAGRTGKWPRNLIDDLVTTSTRTRTMIMDNRNISTARERKNLSGKRT